MRWWAAAIVVLAAACTPQATPTTTTNPPESTTSTLDPAAPPCLTGDLPFTASGPVAALGEDAGDATVLAGIRWEPYAGCERIVFDFFNESGSPASTLGPAGAIAVAESGLLRVSLPAEIETTAIADTLLDGSLAHRAFVGRDPTGTLFVDVHLTSETAVAARAFEAASPIRLIVDLRRGDEPSPVLGPPSLAADTVVVTPPPGATLYPLRISGYARPGVDAVRVRLLVDEEIDVERSVATAGPQDAWTAFDVRLTDGPSGSADLYVGPVDSFGEPINGVTIPLELP